jgi:hypothetical protein
VLEGRDKVVNKCFGSPRKMALETATTKARNLIAEALGHRSFTETFFEDGNIPFSKR